MDPESMSEESRRKVRAILMKRFWTLMEPDQNAYSAMIHRLLNMLDLTALKELVAKMNEEDE